MKVYYYLLYRIYNYYLNDRNSNIGNALFRTNAFSTIVVFFIILAIYLFLNYLDFVPIIESKFYALLVALLLGVVNYYLFIKPKKFLYQHFKKDFNGGVAIVIFLLVVLSSFIIVANFNREKIFKTRPEIEKTVPTEAKPSLEGKIRKWLKDK
jgi:amino acid transporter